MMRRLDLVAIVFLLAACASVSEGSPAVTVAQRETPAPRLSNAVPRGVGAALEPVDSCDALLGYFVEQALDQVGPWGLDGLGGRYLGAVTTAAAADGGEDSSGSGGTEPSSTNVQVEGVDEGDIVKAAGEVLYVLSQGRLRAFSTADGTIAELGSRRLSEQWGADQMLLDGDRLVVVSTGFDRPVRPFESFASDIAPVGSSLARVTLLDVSDPAEPSVLRELTMDGSVVATRLVEGHFRLVLEAYPVGLEFSYPQGSGLRAERAATERNREVIRNSVIENWLPYYVSDAGAEDTVTGCNDVLLPPEPSGLGTLSILDFDLSEGIDTWETASVVASGSTVYANTERAYVATQGWIDPAAVESEEAFSGQRTQIHRFDTPVDGRPTYVASGDVEGFLLNQFAMDEHDGHLRVASTSTPSWWGGGPDSESRVTVLATDANRLDVVGTVEDLGPTETIRAVRFMGAVGYVVTFRQTDPLYVIDLSDPTNPVATGELKVPGYSAYLHPVGPGLLLGVGQDADPETGAVRGLQLSLFDVSDPTAPARLDTFATKPFGDGPESQVWSPVEGDHKAFTLAAGLGFVPFEGWSWSEDDGTESSITGVIAADWSGDSLDASRVFTISEGKATSWQLNPQRTVANGDTLYAIGHGGISVIDLGSGEVLEQLRF